MDDWLALDVVNITFSTFSSNYHLPDVRKMIICILSNVLTCFLGFVNHLGKVFPLAVFQMFLRLFMVSTQNLCLLCMFSLYFLFMSKLILIFALILCESDHRLIVGRK